MSHGLCALQHQFLHFIVLLAGTGHETFAAPLVFHSIVFHSPPVSFLCADGLAGISLFLKQRHAFSHSGIGRQIYDRVVPEGLAVTF